MSTGAEWDVKQRFTSWCVQALNQLRELFILLVIQQHTRSPSTFFFHLLPLLKRTATQCCTDDIFPVTSMSRLIPLYTSKDTGLNVTKSGSGLSDRITNMF